ncbi:hypothetical protein BDV23DRAFT_150484 [Aspergillus alliaceus]|uniref:Uncharacterized protein n=1 Tax=Petromyces alliaceus TaxID=209559 RepID=A0A5N7CFZ9_PETAA|nr:hypothetical protein BDV23DRAFT_150484 [Aspergillus alliaceus]
MQNLAGGTKSTTLSLFFSPFPFPFPFLVFCYFPSRRISRDKRNPWSLFPPCDLQYYGTTNAPESRCPLDADYAFQTVITIFLITFIEL